MTRNEAKEKVLEALEAKRDVGLGFIDSEDMPDLIESLSKSETQWWPASHQLWQMELVTSEVVDALKG